MTACELRRGLFVLLLMVLASAVFSVAARAQSYDDGMRAYDAGDFAKALEIWGPVAENGDAVAQYSLGKLLEIGGAGVPFDLVTAAKWYRRSASQGISSAQNNLGLMYAQGRGVPQDVARAARLWLDAAAQDHVIAQFNLGLAYFRGEGLAEDRIEARRWFRRASELGLADSQYALGQIIRLGLAGEADEAEALHWYQLAVAQGHVKAETQAQKLRDAGVAARIPAAAPVAQQAPEAPAVAASEPPPPPKPVAKPVTPAAAPETVVIEAPEPAAPPATQPVTAGGAYSAWLISFKDAAEARAYLTAAQAKHPALFATAPGRVSAARPGQGGTFHRVLAGGQPDRAAARDFCKRLRAAEPEAFCKVLEN
jgi:TPR repeat protein